MKTKTFLLIIVTILVSTNAEAQFFKKIADKAGKAAERAVERTVEKRVEKETRESTDRVLDSVIDAPKSNKKKRTNKSDSETIIAPDTSSSPNASNKPQIHSNFDFTPGNIVILYDDFKRDAPGDFPSQWDTNGSGEIITIDDSPWFRLGNSSTFLPILQQPLPENYTIEFDLLTQGTDTKTSSQAWLRIFIEDLPGFERNENWSMAELSLCQFISSPGVVEKHEKGSRKIRNNIGKDYRSKLNQLIKVSIAVNKSRMRIWLDENKIVDVPRLVTPGPSYFKLRTAGLRDERNKDEVFISNFRIAESGKDRRSKLITEGRLTTNSILFSSGSANLKEPNHSVIQEIAGALQSNTAIKIMIIGHTDSEGDAAKNLKLSQDRAGAVKHQLVNAYNIDASRIFVSGKGEEDPIADNGTTAGRAKNRRVEFIKL